MQDILNMRRVSKSWLRFVDSNLSCLSHYESGLAVHPQLWKAWSSRWEQLRHLEMPCVDVAILLANGLNGATNLTYIQVHCASGSILKEFLRQLPALQHLELSESDFPIPSGTFAHTTALHTLCIEGCYQLDLRQMAAPEQLTRLEVSLSANLGSISELAPRLASLNLGPCCNSAALLVPFVAPLRFLRTLSLVDVEEVLGDLLPSLKYCPALQALNCDFLIPAEHIEGLSVAFQFLTCLEYLALPDMSQRDAYYCESADTTWRTMCQHLTCLETLKWRRWFVRADAVELMPNMKSLRRFVQTGAGDSTGTLAWCFHVKAPPNFKQPSWHGCDFIPNSQALIDFLLNLEDFFLSAVLDYMEEDSPPYFWNRASLLKLLCRPAESHLTTRNYHCTFLDL